MTETLQRETPARAPLDKETRMRLRMRLLTQEVKQADVAPHLPMNYADLSRVLNGRGPVTPDFEDRFNAAVDEVLRQRAA